MVRRYIHEQQRQKMEAVQESQKNTHQTNIDNCRKYQKVGNASVYLNVGLGGSSEFASNVFTISPTKQELIPVEHRSFFVPL